jgi:hypothetical protein
MGSAGVKEKALATNCSSLEMMDVVLLFQVAMRRIAQREEMMARQIYRGLVLVQAKKRFN